MTAKVSDIANMIEEIAPIDLAEAWDNSGLQVGHHDWEVNTVWVSLDPSIHMVHAAGRQNVDMVVTHHPLIFSPVKCIDLSTPLGAVIETAVCQKVAVFAAHTNLDKAASGINDELARRIGLSGVEVLGSAESETGQGFARIGRLDAGTRLGPLAEKIKQALNLKFVRVAGREDMVVEKAVVCSGSGSSLLGDFFSAGAQVYITGDLRYHDARAVEEEGLGLIDIGHFGSEHLFVDVLADTLRQKAAQAGFDVTVSVYDDEKDPFVIY